MYVRDFFLFLPTRIGMRMCFIDVRWKNRGAFILPHKLPLHILSGKNVHYSEGSVNLLYSPSLSIRFL